jgi:hypothetical protein
VLAIICVSNNVLLDIFIFNHELQSRLAHFTSFLLQQQLNRITVILKMQLNAIHCNFMGFFIVWP